MADEDNSRVDEEKALVRALDETIAHPDLSGVLSGLGEFTLDQALQNGTLRDLPVFGTIAGLARAGIALRDRLFLKKVIRFLEETARVSEEKRTAFLHRVSTDEDYRRRIGSTLVLWLDSLDEIQKAEWLGRAFRAMVAGEVSRAEFLALASATRRVDSWCVDALLDFYSREAPEWNRTPVVSTELQQLAFAGLVTIGFGTGGTFGNPGGAYHQNETGLQFVRIVLDRKTVGSER